MIKIIIDSASDITQDEAAAQGIHLLPMEVRFGDTMYLDGANLSHREFFEKLIESNDLPMQLVEKCGGIDYTMPYGLVYSGLNDEYLQKYLQDSEALWQQYVADVKAIPSYMIGSTIGTHVGPNAIGVSFFAN